MPDAEGAGARCCTFWEGVASEIPTQCGVGMLSSYACQHWRRSHCQMQRLGRPSLTPLVACKSLLYP
eukprot:363901-Chlamydomonas_euryale.AAC.40